jgi:hypothetical protein
MSIFKIPFTMKLEWKVAGGATPTSSSYFQYFEKLKRPKELYSYYSLLIHEKYQNEHAPRIWTEEPGIAWLKQEELPTLTIICDLNPPPIDTFV